MRNRHIIQFATTLRAMLEASREPTAGELAETCADIRKAVLAGGWTWGTATAAGERGAEALRKFAVRSVELRAAADDLLAAATEIKKLTEKRERQ